MRNRRAWVVKLHTPLLCTELTSVLLPWTNPAGVFTTALLPSDAAAVVERIAAATRKEKKDMCLFHKRFLLINKN